MRRILAFVIGVALACSGDPPGGAASAAPAPSPPPAAPQPAPTAAEPARTGIEAPRTMAEAPRDAIARRPRPAAAPADALDFGPQAALLFRIAACGGDGALPAGIDPKVVEKHCKVLRDAMDEYRKKWLDIAAPFLAGVVPRGLPTAVVYPFGGADLLTALATFPDATEVTTISLEPIGDPRAIDRLRGKKLEQNLKVNQHTTKRLFVAAFSATEELEKAANTDLPGLLIYGLAAAVVHGYEPVALRYFMVKDDGSLRYLTAEDVEKADEEAKKGRKKKRWGPYEVPDSVWNNCELTLRRGEKTLVWRHIAANLYDDQLKKMPGLIPHLEQKGRVAAMTKAASHLLWYKQTSRVRDYLLKHMEWMISDATGIPPEWARTAGFEQVTWGKYVGAYFGHRNPDAERQFVELWTKNPQKELPFRYGYFDKKYNNHMLVTRRAR